MTFLVSQSQLDGLSPDFNDQIENYFISNCSKWKKEEVYNGR